MLSGRATFKLLQPVGGEAGSFVLGRYKSLLRRCAEANRADPRQHRAWMLINHLMTWRFCVQKM